MMKNQRLLYSPALRLKEGELIALSLLASDVADHVMPRLVIPPLADRDEPLQGILFDEVRVPTLGAYVSRYWSGRPVLVDTQFLAPQFEPDEFCNLLPQSRLAAEMPVDVAKIETSRAGEQRHRDQIPEIRRQAAELEAFIAEYEGFTAHRSVWEEMAEEDIARLKELMQIARKNFRDLTTYQVPSGIDAVRDVCMRRMITGDQEAFGALPDPLLSFINEKYRLTTQSPHQLFGLAGVKQDNLYDNLENLLLLQLSYDDLNEWQFGDMGLWHFWISPSDVAAGRWERAKLTFEAS